MDLITSVAQLVELQYRIVERHRNEQCGVPLIRLQESVDTAPLTIWPERARRTCYLWEAETPLEIHTTDDVTILYCNEQVAIRDCATEVAVALIDGAAALPSLVGAQFKYGEAVFPLYSIRRADGGMRCVEIHGRYYGEAQVPDRDFDIRLQGECFTIWCASGRVIVDVDDVHLRFADRAALTHFVTSLCNQAEAAFRRLI